MRYAKLLVLLAGLSGLLWAADPFAGTWKLNIQKSKYGSGQPPKEQTVTIAEKGSDIHVSIKGISATGAPISSEYTVPAKGGTGKVISSALYDAITSKRISDNTVENTYTKGGKQVLTTRSVLAPDGKSMTVTVKGVDAEGKPIDVVAVYERM